MTIAVACNLADGLVMGADSAVTVEGLINTLEGKQEGILKIYNDAEKLFSIHNLPIGVVTYGLSLLQKRTMQSYIREFEHSYTQTEVELWPIEKVARTLWAFFQQKYRQAFAESLEKRFRTSFEEIPAADKPTLGFMVGGFSPDRYLSELWDVEIQKASLQEGVNQTLGPGIFGSAWRGETEGLRRFHKGFSFGYLDAIIQSILDHYQVQLDPTILNKIQTIVGDADYKIPWDGMPLQEGIDYVKFCLDLMINQTKFVIGAPTCGGNIRLAVIRGAITSGEKKFHYVTHPNFVIR